MGGNPEAAAAEEPAWEAAQRVEEWAGEARVNLIRLVAIAAFYAHHLVQYYLLKLPLTPRHHLAATGIAVAWSVASMALHLALVRQVRLPWIKYLALLYDALMITGLLALTEGGKSPLVVLLFLLVATSALRMQVRMAWATTVLAVAAYLFVLGHDRWGRNLPADQRVPRRNQVIFVLGLGAAGVLAGQALRQARRFARDYADRVRPEGPA